MIKTDHILFIASGAFHLSKPSDLIPELQGRLPIRVELSALSVEDFVRILREPDASLTEQYSALMKTEDLNLEFTDDGLQRLQQRFAGCGKLHRFHLLINIGKYLFVVIVRQRNACV